MFIKTVLSKIKLKSYEKQWLMSWVGLILLILLLRLTVTRQPEGPIFGLIALLTVLWCIVNLGGLCFCVAYLVKDWISDPKSESIFRRIYVWLRTDDRY